MAHMCSGTKIYCLLLDDVTMFTQPQYEILVKLAKWGTNYGNDVFWILGTMPWPKCPLATPMVVV